MYVHTYTGPDDGAECRNLSCVLAYIGTIIPHTGTMFPRRWLWLKPCWVRLVASAVVDIPDTRDRYVRTTIGRGATRGTTTKRTTTSDDY